jgi:hypothetical protein
MNYLAKRSLKINFLARGRDVWPIISAPWRLRQYDFKFQANPCCTVRTCFKEGKIKRNRKERKRNFLLTPYVILTLLEKIPKMK